MLLLLPGARWGSFYGDGGLEDLEILKFRLLGLPLPGCVLWHITQAF